LALVGLAVRLLLTPTYLQLEYRLPNFPPDGYGFSTEDRLLWGAFGVRYLLNDAPIAYLADLKFNDGEPLFSDRELQHMLDVKHVLRRLLGMWSAILAALILLGVWSRARPRLELFLAGVRAGAWLTLGIAAACGVFGILALVDSGQLFWAFFSGFHGLFFVGDSWLFAYSDTLIRLYPLRFWQDSIIYIGALTTLGAAALLLAIPRPVTPAARA
jgi:integral membrane protein (TIGR01906 family)